MNENVFENRVTDALIKTFPLLPGHQKKFLRSIQPQWQIKFCSRDFNLTVKPRPWGVFAIN